MSVLKSEAENKHPSAGPVGIPQANDPETRERAIASGIVEQLRQELSVVSRQAGMAEVATGTLHNVGNVLNSIGVAAGVVTAKLRESRVQNLAKALHLLREHREDLANFLASDPKGKMLPAYLETLAEHLAAEQADMRREMETLGHNLEHVREIVALQQSYAKNSGVLEPLQLADLAGDALRMNLGAFERHGITITRSFSPVPAVLVDRHRVLQILINLFRNAKYAMDEAGVAEKRLTLEIAAAGQDRVRLTVRDNGIGIARENLSRIFDHGFTTKRDGHGFGLHSGARAALELGGRLYAESEGKGTGAAFLLELPVAGNPFGDDNHANATRSATSGGPSGN
jgi:signal transduction histidine kinase